MAKKLINLLIDKEEDSKILRKLKKITPISSAALLIIFVILHVISLIYVRLNVNDYNNLKNKVSGFETRIATAKSAESIYITTYSILEKIKNIQGRDTKIINNTLPVLFEYQNEAIVIDNITIDNNGPVTFFVKTTSVDALNYFVDELKKGEGEFGYANVKASSILRENDGSYTFTVNLNVNTKK